MAASSIPSRAQRAADDAVVEEHPEEKTYLEISNESMAVTFPEPGPLEGVKSCSEVIFRMNFTTWRNTRREHPHTTPRDASLVTMIARA